MNSRYALLVTVIAAGLAYRPAANTAPSSASGEKHSAANGKQALTYDKQLELENWPRETLDKTSEICAPATICDTRFIIATVPDPKNTPDQLLFDRLLESIQLGAGDSKYTLDRFWLPWEADSGPVDSDFLLHSQHEEWLKRMQEEPGVLVFRANRTAGKLPPRLCIFVVGENPITGINQEEFARAIEIIPEESRTRLEILGPTFSGSIATLGEALNVLPSTKEVTVATGTATAGDNEERLANAVSKTDIKVRWRQLIGTDNDGICAFLSYATRKTSAANIAILREGTTFAKEISQPASGKSCAGMGQIKTLEYPMEISRMRNAYGSSPGLAALSNASISDSPQQGLEIPLKDEHDSEDIVPTFSSELRPVSQEATILNVLATISQSRIQYVGIASTDVLDALFLGRLLKQHCPNVRPFILDSDLVYGSVSQNNAFNGMLLITSYPLLRKPARQDPHQFSSATEQGEYEATLQAIRDVNHDGAASTFTPPAATIAVVGRDGVWPVKGPDKGWDFYPSAGWRMVFAVVSLFCLAFSGGIIYFTVRHQSKEAANRQQGAESETTPAFTWLSALLTATEQSRTVLTLACCLLLAFYAVVAVIELQASYSLLAIAGTAISSVTLTMLLAAICCCWLEVKAWWLVGLLVVSGLLCLPLRLHEFFSGSTFIYRSLHVGSGVAPVSPLLFVTAALFWWTYCHLNRLRLLKLFPDKSPAFESDSYLNSAEALHDELFVILQKWNTGHWKWAVGLAFVLAFSVVMFNPIHILSVETFAFEWFYAAALYALCFGLLLECVRFVRAWGTLENLLHKIEHHVLCDVFRRLPDELSPAYLWKFGNRGPSLLVVAHFVNRLKVIADKQLSMFGDRYYDNKLNDIRQYTRHLMTGGEARPQINILAIGRMNGHIEDVLRRLVKVTSYSWGSIPIAERVASQTVGGHSLVPQAEVAISLADSIEDIAEEMIALRFVEIIAQVNLHMKNNLAFITGALILAVISLNCYPFEPHRSMTSMLTIYFFATGAVFLMVFMQMSRNTIISYLNGTEAGKLDGSVFHLVSFGGLPLIAVISSQFPSIGGFLFAWVKPALEALR